MKIPGQHSSNIVFSALLEAAQGQMKELFTSKGCGKEMGELNWE